MAKYGSIQLRGNGDSDSVQAGGKRVKLNRTLDDGRVVPVTAFESAEDLHFAMTVVDPATGKDLYETSAAYRESVKDILANSPAVLHAPTLARKSAIPSDNDMLQGLREDAILDLHDRMIDAAGGRDKVLKYNTMLDVVQSQGEKRDQYAEMHALTTKEKPMENYLKQRKHAGHGPLRWSVPVDAETAIGGVDEQAQDNGPIIKIDGGN